MHPDSSYFMSIWMLRHSDWLHPICGFKPILLGFRLVNQVSTRPINSRVFFMPSDVSSNAQANISANGKPMARRRISVLNIQSGAPNTGNRISSN